MTELRVSAFISIYSQNVSCDKHSENLQGIDGMENFEFRNRIELVIFTLKMLKPLPDIVAMNEIRHEENLTRVKDLLEDTGYVMESFSNNSDAMSFSNILAIRKDSEWEKLESRKKWVALHENSEAYMKDSFDKIKGDPHGRCAGIVYLRHKTTHCQVCVLVSHVVPFGDVKIHQQNALLSLSGENLKRKPPVPTIIVGDLNRFWDDREVFDKQLQKYKVCEAKPKKLIIRHRHNEKNIQEEFEGRDVGTFSPWPTDSAVYERLLKEPISKSPLDVQLLTDDTSLIEEETTETYAAMMREPNKHTPPRGRDPVRHKLDKRMASDHLAILGKYQVKRHPENQPELPLYKQAITWFQPCVLL